MPGPARRTGAGATTDAGIVIAHRSAASILGRQLRRPCQTSPEVVRVSSDDDWDPEPADLREDEQEDEDTHAERIAEQLRMLDEDSGE
jgi:hypothetical protein